MNDGFIPRRKANGDGEAAASALVGITAYLGLFLHAALKPWETVLVNGGTGGRGLRRRAVCQIEERRG